MIAEAVSTVSGQLIFGDTKTHRVRTVQLTPFVADMLAKHLEDVDMDPDALVFTAPKGGPLRYSNFRRKFWNPARERLDSPT